MTFALPVLSSAGASILQQLIDNDTDLVKGFAGTSAPSNPTAGQEWNDTSTGLRKQWDGAAWQITGPIYANGARRSLTLYQGVLVGGEVWYLPVQATKIIVASVALISTVATSGSDGANNWSVQLADITGAVNLFATAPSTNGSELVVDTAWRKTPDQNATVIADHVLKLTVTKTGAPTSLAAARVLVQVDVYPRAT